MSAIHSKVMPTCNLLVSWRVYINYTSATISAAVLAIRDSLQDTVTQTAVLAIGQMAVPFAIKSQYQSKALIEAQDNMIYLQKSML